MSRFPLLLLLLLLACLVRLAAAPAINLTWTDNSNNETGFEVWRSIDGTNFANLASVAANATAFRDSAVNPATRYWYRVRAYNTAGESAFSNTANVTTPADPLPGDLPTAPGGINLTIPGNVTNVSTRGPTTINPSDPNNLIPGFIVAGGPVRVLVRVMGSELAAVGVPNPAPDPRFHLTNSAQATFATVDNWDGTPANRDAVRAAEAELTGAGLFGFPLVAGSKSAAVVVTLQPGSYTFVVNATGTAGIVLAEVYELTP